MNTNKNLHMARFTPKVCRFEKVYFWREVFVRTSNYITLHYDLPERDDSPKVYFFNTTHLILLYFLLMELSRFMLEMSKILVIKVSNLSLLFLRANITCISFLKTTYINMLISSCQ